MRPMTWDDEEEDDVNDVEDREGPDASDMDHDDDPELVACPFCRALISEDADRCPGCGNFISQTEKADHPRRMLWLIIAVLAAAALILLAFKG